MSYRARWLRGALALALVGGVLLALRSAAQDAGTVDWPDPPAMTVAAGLVVLTHAGGALSWLTLFEGRGSRRRLIRAYAVGQLGKYVPGGVVQVAGLYDQTRRAGITRDDVSVRVPVHVLVVTLGPCAFAAVVLAVADAQLATAARFALGLCGLGCAALLLRRDWLKRALDVAHRRWVKVPAGTSVPATRSIYAAAALGSLGAAAYGAAVAVLLGPDGWRDHLIVGSAFLVAFAVGFLALPFPSGLGVREAVFVGLVGSVALTPDALAVAVVLRVVQLAVEMALAGPVLVASRRPHSTPSSASGRQPEEVTP